jgi:hypothetical protein
MNNANATDLDTMTATLTAFATFADMVAACRAGYVPTVREDELAEALCLAGCRIWRS